MRRRAILVAVLLSILAGRAGRGGAGARRRWARSRSRSTSPRRPGTRAAVRGRAAGRRPGRRRTARGRHPVPRRHGGRRGRRRRGGPALDRVRARLCDAAGCSTSSTRTTRGDLVVREGSAPATPPGHAGARSCSRSRTRASPTTTAVSSRSGRRQALYASTGDGGGQGDPGDDAQNPSSRLGKILRSIPRGPGAGGVGARSAQPVALLVRPRDGRHDHRRRRRRRCNEEIDFAPAGAPAGRNYGWVRCEGAGPLPGARRGAAGAQSAAQRRLHRRDRRLRRARPGPADAPRPLRVRRHHEGPWCCPRRWAPATAPRPEPTLPVSFPTSFGEDGCGHVYVALERRRGLAHPGRRARATCPPIPPTCCRRAPAPRTAAAPRTRWAARSRRARRGAPSASCAAASGSRHQAARRASLQGHAPRQAVPHQTGDGAARTRRGSSASSRRSRACAGCAARSPAASGTGCGSPSGSARATRPATRAVPGRGRDCVNRRRAVARPSSSSHRPSANPSASHP